MSRSDPLRGLHSATLSPDERRAIDAQAMPPVVIEVARAVAGGGGLALIIGGWVRDALVGQRPKDADLEVHGLARPTLARVLRKLGKVHEVGRSFGVFKLHRRSGPPLDVALPRADSLPGDQGAPQASHDMGLDQASLRRDLTVNAIAFDPLTGKVWDPRGGLADLRARRLRPCDASRFLDDPLRALRVARFASALSATPSPELRALCNQAPTGGLPGERLRMELGALLMRTSRPGAGVQLALETGALPRAVPGTEALSDAAGLVQGVDAAAALRDRAGPPPGAAALMWAALLWPLPTVGVLMVLERLRLQRQVGVSMPDQIVGAIAVAAALGGDPWPPLASLADNQGIRGGLLLAQALHPARAQVLEKAWNQADAQGILDHRLPELLTGKDLAGLGIPRGRSMGTILAGVREAQLRGEVSTIEQALQLAHRLWQQSPTRHQDG